MASGGFIREPVVLVEPSDEQTGGQPGRLVIPVDGDGLLVGVDGAPPLAQMLVHAPSVEMREFAVIVPGGSDGLVQPTDGLVPAAQLNESRFAR